MSELARARKSVADEEDVAQNVFFSLCRGAAAGRFEDVRNRDELWWLMLAMTRQKSIDLIRREKAKKRGGGKVHSESALVDGSHTGNGQRLDQLIGDSLTPEYLVAFAEESRRLMGLLRDDELRKIAVSRIEGYTVSEIAAGLALSTRSIQRKLQLIRDAWTRELIRAERDLDTK